MLLKEVMCADTNLQVILCNIYAPNKEDPHFFHEVNRVLREMDGQIILAGDFTT